MAEKIKKPITEGVAKVPVVMQLEALECGAASLCMVMAYYNKWVPLEQVREDCGVSRDGSNARNVLKAARFYGFEAKGYRYEPETLRKKGKFPCIIHWNFNHFVVLDGFKGNKAYLNDPAKGTYSVPMETFDASFTGICLQFEPAESFVPSGKPKSMLAFAKKRLKGTGVAVTFTVLTGVVGALMGFLGSFMSPAMTLVSAGQTLQEMRTQMERVDDVMEYPDDTVFDESEDSEAIDSLKCTRIVIAHRLSTIHHADRIIYLDSGKIAEDGTYEELIARNGRFARLVERQRLDID